MTRELKINKRFIASSFGGNIVRAQDSSGLNGYYHRIFHNAVLRGAYSSEGLTYLGSSLASLARQADISRRIDQLEQISELMLALPIPKELRTVGQLYRGLCLTHQGRVDDGQRIIEQAVDAVPNEFKGRALQSLGMSYIDRSDIDTAAPIFVAASKAAAGYDPLALIQSQWGLAITRSVNGDHKRALADLECLFPLVGSLSKHYPGVYYNFLNSLAVEFGEVGRLHEAHGALSIALASPFAPAQPGWAETQRELEAKRTAATPSVVAVSRPADSAPSKQPRRKRKSLRVNARVLRWLFGISALTAKPLAAAAVDIIKPASEAALFKISDWPMIGPGPRAPPANSHLI